MNPLPDILRAFDRMATACERAGDALDRLIFALGGDAGAAVDELLWDMQLSDELDPFA